MIFLPIGKLKLQLAYHLERHLKKTFKLPCAETVVEYCDMIKEVNVRPNQSSYPKWQEFPPKSYPCEVLPAVAETLLAGKIQSAKAINQMLSSRGT